MKYLSKEEGNCGESTRISSFKLGREENPAARVPHFPLKEDDLGIGFPPYVSLSLKSNLTERKVMKSENPWL